MVPFPVSDCFITSYYYEVCAEHHNVQCKNYALTLGHIQLRRFEALIFGDVHTPELPPKIKVADIQHI